jgi:hypothetical protein
MIVPNRAREAIYRFDVDSSHQSLQDAKQRALQLYPEDDPSSHIFFSMAQNGSLKFEAKEKNFFRRLFQRLFVRSLTPEKTARITANLQIAELRQPNQLSLRNMVELIDSARSIFAHINHQRRELAHEDVSKLRQTDIFATQAKTLLSSLHSIVKPEDITSILQEECKEFADRISMRKYDEIKLHLAPKADESFEELLARITKDLHQQAIEKNPQNLQEQLQTIPDNIFAKCLLAQIEEEESQRRSSIN